MSLQWQSGEWIGNSSVVKQRQQIDQKASGEIKLYCLSSQCSKPVTRGLQLCISCRVRSGRCGGRNFVNVESCMFCFQTDASNCDVRWKKD